MARKINKFILHGAATGRGFFSPVFSRFAFFVMHILYRPYMWAAERVAGVRVLGMENLHNSFIGFNEGRHRLILVFRHVAREDGPVVLQTVAKELPRWCRRRGIQLSRPVHSHFLYGKDVLNYAGAGARWLFPRVGGIPVVNRIVDRQSLETIRMTLLDGRFPLALAPEGQVTYHMFKAFDLEGGTATLSVWAYKHLAHKSRQADVHILPISIGYDFSETPDRIYRRVFQYIEESLGIEIGADLSLYKRLLAATSAIITILEDFYSSTYPNIFKPVKDDSLRARITQVCDGILRCGESMLGLHSQGSILERVFKLRYKGMYSRYPENLDIQALPPIRRYLTDFRSIGSYQYILHNQIVDVLEYLSPDDIWEGCSEARSIEYALNLADVINRIFGGNVDSRLKPGRKRATVLVGEPLRLSDYAGKYQGKDLTGVIEGELFSRLSSLSARMEYLLDTGLPSPEGV